MKYVLLCSICVYAFSMDTEQLYQQLCTIICNGAVDDFRSNLAQFQAYLTYQDIKAAKRSCDVRLQTIIDFQCYNDTGCIGPVVIDFIQKLNREPHRDQFLASQKRKTQLLANALQRILCTKNNVSWQDHYFDKEGQWGLNCSQDNKNRPER